MQNSASQKKCETLKRNTSPSKKNVNLHIIFVTRPPLARPPLESLLIILRPEKIPAEKCVDPTFFWPKKLSAEKIVGRNVFSVERIFGQSFFQPKNISNKKCFDRKHFRPKKNSGARPARTAEVALVFLVEEAARQMPDRSSAGA